MKEDSKQVYVVNELSEQGKERAIRIFIQVIKEEMLKEKLIDEKLFNDKDFNEQLYAGYKIKAIELMMAEGMLFSKDGDVLPESVNGG